MSGNSKLHVVGTKADQGICCFVPSKFRPDPHLAWLAPRLLALFESWSESSDNPEKRQSQDLEFCVRVCCSHQRFILI